MSENPSAENVAIQTLVQLAAVGVEPVRLDAARALLEHVRWQAHKRDASGQKP